MDSCFMQISHGSIKAIFLLIKMGIPTCILENLASICLPNLHSKPVLYWFAILIKLSKLFGSQSVPTLALFSFYHNSYYAKFLCTIIESLSLQLATVHNNYMEGSIIKRTRVTQSMVWGLDGSLVYGHYPHIFLLFATVIFLILIWIPIHCSHFLCNG